MNPSTRGRIGALRLYATHDPREVTAKARAVFSARWEQKVDPEGILDPEERARRAQYAKRAYMTELASRPRKKRRAA